MPDTLPALPESPPPQGGRGFTHDNPDKNTDCVQARQMVLIDQMIAWQIANPGKKWTQCAQALGVSILWCRMMASTDAFKARYSEVKDSIIREIGLLGL